MTQQQKEPQQPKKRAPYVPVTLDEETRARLEDQHEDILVVKGGERAPWVLVLRRPNRQETLAFKAHARKDSATANEALIRRVTVYPDPKSADFDKQLERWALIPDFVADSQSFKEFLGGGIESDLK